MLDLTYFIKHGGDVLYSPQESNVNNCCLIKCFNEGFIVYQEHPIPCVSVGITKNSDIL